MKKLLLLLIPALLLLGIAIPSSATPIAIGGTQYYQTGATENVNAPFSTADGGVTGSSYYGFVELTVEGVGQSYKQIYNDAFYLFSPPPIGYGPIYYQLAFDTIALVPYNPAREVTNFIVYDIDADVEVAPAYVPEYQADHTYNFVINLGSATGNIHFGVSDGIFSDNTGAYSIDVTQLSTVAPVPEPTTILLSSLGLLGMGAYLRRRKKK